MARGCYKGPSFITEQISNWANALCGREILIVPSISTVCSAKTDALGDNLVHKSVQGRAEWGPPLDCSTTRA